MWKGSSCNQNTAHPKKLRLFREISGLYQTKHQENRDKLTYCFLIQPYYTPFFTKIQAFCKNAYNFVDSDKIYVNFVMSTFQKTKHLFLSFSIILTTSCVFLPHQSLNIVFEFSPSFRFLRVNFIYLRCLFVYYHSLRFLLPPPLFFFSAL